LFSSILASILAQVLNAETSHQLWQQLQISHTSQSVAKILELKLSLQTLKKDGSTCAQFIQHIQSLAYRLRSIGCQISDQDLVLYTLQGLGSDYESFVTAFSMRSADTSMLELQSLVLSHEARIQATSKSSASFSANLTSSHSDNFTSVALYTSSSNPNPSFKSNFSQTQPRSQYYRGIGGHRGRGRGRYQSQHTESACQICYKWGHSAVTCYHRFDIRYVGTTSSQPQALLSEPVPTPVAAQTPIVPAQSSAPAAT
jgi:gag-polypeptide of LTR copia-type